MYEQIAAIFSKEGLFFTLLTLFASWISPAMELAFLLYFFVGVDYLIDMYLHIRQRGLKAGIWKEITQPTVSKVIWYTILIVVLNAAQLHMFKSTISAYTIIMALPISSELISITKSIEEQTGLKLITKVTEIMESWVGIKSKTKEDKENSN